MKDLGAVVAAFLDKAFEDREAGGVRSLESYQSLFPGHEELIAGEYAALVDDRHESLTEADGSSPVLALRPGALVGRYRLEREIGRGGQGVVYAAVDTRLADRPVALKMMPPTGHASLARFLREAEVASRLDHPGICPVYEAGVHQGTAYIAMRYVDGTTLETELENVAPIRSREDVLRYLELFQRCAEALHVAHEAGIVHRDLKPGNVILEKSGNPVLLDFGLASDEDSDHPTITRTGDVFGTPAYMSPEQVRGQGRDVDRRSDVFSLGVCLYEAVVGRRPFEAATREALFRAIRLRDPVAAHKRNRAIPSDLTVVLDTALEKEPDRRYATARELAEDIRRVREFEPILARPVGPATRALRWMRRNPVPATYLAILFVVLNVGVGTVTHFWSESRHRREEAHRSEERARWKAYLRGVNAAAAALGRHEIEAARRHLAEAPREHRRWFWRHLDRSCETSLAVTDLGSAVRALTIDGDRLVVGLADGRVLSMPPGGGPIVEETVAAGEPGAMAFDAGRRAIAWVRLPPDGVDAPRILLSDMDSGTPTLLKGPGGTIAGITFDRRHRLWCWGKRGANPRPWPHDGVTAWDSEGARVVSHDPGGPAASLVPLGGGALVGGGVRDTSRLVRLDERGRVVWEVDLRGEECTALALSGDERLAVVGLTRKDGASMMATVETRTGRVLRYRDAGAERVTALAVSPSGRRVASGTSTGTIFLDDIGFGARRIAHHGHVAAIAALAYLPSGTLVSGSDDGHLRWWDEVSTSRRVLETLHLNQDGRPDFDTRGERIAIGGRGLEVHELGDGSASAHGELSSVWVTRFASEGPGLTVFGAREGVGCRAIFALTSQGLVEREKFERKQGFVARSPGGLHAAGRDADGLIRIWRMQDMAERVVDFPAEFAPARPESGSIAVADDGSVAFWAARSDRIAFCWNDGSRRMLDAPGTMAVAFSRSSRMVALANESGDVRVIDRAGGTIVDLSGAGAAGETLAWHPDEHLLAVGCRNGQIVFHSVEHGDAVGVLHPGFVPHHVAFDSAGDSFACSGGASVTIVWEARARRSTVREAVRLRSEAEAAWRAVVAQLSAPPEKRSWREVTSGHSSAIARDHVLRKLMSVVESGADGAPSAAGHVRSCRARMRQLLEEGDREQVLEYYHEIADSPGLRDACDDPYVVASRAWALALTGRVDGARSSVLRAWVLLNRAQHFTDLEAHRLLVEARGHLPR